MEHALSEFPGRVERVPAVTVCQLEDANFSRYLANPGVEDRLAGMSDVDQKTVSCWLSHVTLWERLRTELRPDETALILEDDVQFSPQWAQDLIQTVHSAPAGWHTLKVCGWGHDREEDAVDDTWTVPRWPMWENGHFLYTGTCGYIVAGSTLPVLLRHVLNQPIKDIDVAMMLPQKAEVNTSAFAIYEQRPGHRLLHTGGFSSTIRASGNSGDPEHRYHFELDSWPGCYKRRFPVRCKQQYPIAKSFQVPTNSSMQWHLCCKEGAHGAADSGRAPSAWDVLGSLSADCRLQWVMPSLTLTASAVGAAVHVLTRWHHNTWKQPMMDAHHLP